MATETTAKISALMMRKEILERHLELFDDPALESDWEKTADALLELEDAFLASSAGVGMAAAAV